MSKTYRRSILSLSVGTVLILTACAVRSVTPGDTMEVNMDFDLSSIGMRHGWALLTPPELKYTGSNDAEGIARGKVLFQQHCQKCHGETGIGDGPLAKELKIKPANLQKISNDKSNTYLVVEINNGKGDMPKWQDFLTKQQTYDLTNYIRTLKKSDQPKNKEKTSEQNKG